MVMAEGDGSFLSRWSRRKVQVKQGLPVAPEQPVVPAVPAPVAATLPAPIAVRAEAGKSSAEPAAPSPTLDDVAELTKDSDFSRFVARNVDPDVKSAAMKKLFADPHFNVMDGLDTYIDDYGKFEPIPKSMLRQMVSARMLGLLDDELEEQPKPDNSDAPVNEPHENADLQLQPDDAAGQPGAEQSAAAGRGDRADPAHDAVPPRST
jgi:hypothetical protein